MKSKVIEKIGEKISEYAESVGIDTIRVVAHGGEPLLLGSDGLDLLFTQLRAASGRTRLRLGLQTNGVLLSREICEILRKHSVFVGISLDGDSEANSRRIDHRGRQSWSRVIKGIETLKQYAPNSFGGILCVVDTSASPEAVVRAVCDIAPPQVDFLQPFLTHDMAGTHRDLMAAEFGTWMIHAMETWLEEPKYRDIRIRVFEDAFRAACGQPTQTDWFGRRAISYLVVESDGSIDVLDQLKVIGEQSSDYRLLKKTVFDSTLSEAISIAEQLLQSYGALSTPAGCRECRYVETCAASHLTSRYSSQTGFANKSTYCEGLQMVLDNADRILRNRYAKSSAN